VPVSGRNQSILGVVFDSSSYSNYASKLLENTTFSSFSTPPATWQPQWLWGDGRRLYWNAGSASRSCASPPVPE